MASSNVSTVYISVIDDVIAKVREDFITYGVGDAVLNELQALWEMKMLHCGAISGNIDRSKATAAASAGAAAGAGATPPVHDLNMPYEATSEEYATPTADMLFPPTPLQTPIQTPLPGTEGMYNIPTGPSDYAPSPISDVRNGMAMNGTDPKTGRPSSYMPPPSPWMNQRPLGVDVNVAYVESREDPESGVQPQPLTQGGPKSSGDGGPTQRASALAALSTALNPSGQGKQLNERPTSSGDGGPTQRASAMAALSSALGSTSKPGSPHSQSRSGQGSQRAAAVAALSNVLTAEGSCQSPIAEAEKAEFAPSAASPQSEAGHSEFHADKDDSGRTEPDVSQEQTANENGGETTFSYNRLISKSTNPVSGIDYKRRETYLSDSEFQTVFGMTKDEFYEQPRWKQEMQKRKADLF